MEFSDALLTAVEQNDNDAVRQLLAQHPQLANSDDGVNPLYLAVSNGNDQIVRLLLEGGADPNNRDVTGYTPLYCATTFGYSTIVDMLLEKNADPNLKCSSISDTPLHKASELGYFSIAQSLISSGADVNARSNDGKTPIFSAITNSHIDIVKYLAEHDANIKIRAKDGRTCLHDAALAGSLEIISFLIEHGLDKNATAKDNTTVLFDATRAGNFDIVKFLLENGADPKIKNDLSESLLHVAASSGNPDLVLFCLNIGGNVKSKSKDGNIPLHNAVCSGNSDVVSLLIDNGSEINAKNKFGETPLYQLASSDGNIEIAKILLQKGADKEIANKKGLTPVDIAIKHQQYEIAHLLDPSIDIHKEEGSTDSDQPSKFSTVDLTSALANAITTQALNTSKPSDNVSEEQNSQTDSGLNEEYTFEIDDSASTPIDESTLKECETIKASEKGTIVQFGRYHQDAESDAEFKPIEWIVLEKWPSRVLMISKYSLDAKPYHRGEKPVTWDRCILRKWLNTSFYTTAFTPSEQKCIYNADLPSGKNPRFNTNPGHGTKDRIFVLSLPEVERYLPTKDIRKCYPTAYTKAQAVYVDDITCSVRWCLRSPGRNNCLVAFGSITGELDYPGGFTGNIAYAIRPALWVKV